jgi:hypothetical protein
MGQLKNLNIPHVLHPLIFRTHFQPVCPVELFNTLFLFNIENIIRYIIEVVEIYPSPGWTSIGVHHTAVVKFIRANEGRIPRFLPCMRAGGGKWLGMGAS